MRKTCLWIAAGFFLMAIFFVCGCVTEQTALKVEKTLPQSNLTRYSDSFDKFREDLWERSQYTYSKAQRQSFKLADITIDNGKLRIKTKPGGFSKGALASKFYLRGDFDVQIECDFEFSTRTGDMDQVVFFVILEKDKAVRRADACMIYLERVPETGEGALCSSYQIRGTFYRASRRMMMHGFHGTLRFVKVGKKVTALYKEIGAGEWSRLHTCKLTGDVFGLGFSLQNFIPRRTYIRAKTSLVASFDNFKINAAQEIIEPEI